MEKKGSGFQVNNIGLLLAWITHNAIIMVISDQNFSARTVETMKKRDIFNWRQNAFLLLPTFICFFILYKDKLHTI